MPKSGGYDVIDGHCGLTYINNDLKKNSFGITHLIFLVAENVGRQKSGF